MLEQHVSALDRRGGFVVCDDRKGGACVLEVIVDSGGGRAPPQSATVSASMHNLSSSERVGVQPWLRMNAYEVAFTRCRCR